MSTMSANPKVTVSPTKEKIQFESPNLSILKNVTTVSIVTVTSESTVISAGSCPPEVTTPPSNGTTVPSKLVTTPPSPEGTVPPKGTAESTVSALPRPKVSVPSVSVESISPANTVESTESVPLEVTSESKESIPPELTVTSVESTVPLNTIQPIESVQLEVTNSESTESIPSELDVIAPVESVPLTSTVEPTESHVQLEVTNSESTESIPPELVVASVESVPLNSTVEPIESHVQLEITNSESTESIPPELAVASVESVPLNSTVEPTENHVQLTNGSCPPEVTTPPSNGTTVPSKVVTTTPSPEGTVPPKGTTESIVSVPPRPEVSVPSVSVESISPNTIESTESVSLEVTSSESTETIPPELTVAPPVESVPLNTVEPTESHVQLEVTSESTTESIAPAPELAVACVETSVPLYSTTVEPTESAPLEVTNSESIPLNGTTSSSLTGVPLPPDQSIVESTESSVHLESTSESTDQTSVPSTEISDPSLVTKPTEGVAPVEEVSNSSSSIASTASPEANISTENNIPPPRSTTMSNVSPPLPPESAVVSDVVSSTEGGVVPPDSKVTNASTENSNPPDQSTTAANVGALSPGLTVANSSLTTSGAHDDLDQLRAKARDDAINLNRAFEGIGCDATTIVNILSKRSATSRILIKEEYKAKFSEDFDNRLSKELMFKPDLKRAVSLWMDEPACRDAKLVNDGLSKNINAAIEVICSRTPTQIEQLKKAYRKMFGVYLMEDIKSHAHFEHKKLLLEYAGKQRSESLEVDEKKVDEDAKILFRDGEWKHGTNEETFIRILSERSSAHLAALNFAYRTMYVNSLKKAVKKETSFKVNFILKFALLTILQCAENRAKYFAKALHKAMKGFGTDDETLTRIIVSRAEVDIQQIKAEYEKKYRKTLADDIHSDTSRHYRAFLLSLLDFNAA